MLHKMVIGMLKEYVYIYTLPQSDTEETDDHAKGKNWDDNSQWSFWVTKTLNDRLFHIGLCTFSVHVHNSILGKIKAAWWLCDFIPETISK